MTERKGSETMGNEKVMDTGQVPELISTSQDLGKRPLYVSDTAPEFDLFGYKGERYEALVPDTYDVSQRARAMQNILTRAVEPDYDYLMYFSVRLGRNPVSMGHGISDICTTKYMQGLSLVRLITGDETRMEVDTAWHEMEFKQMGPDGLTYFTARPYMESWIPYLTDENADFFSTLEMNYMPPFAIQYLRRPDSLWEQAMRRQVDGLVSIAVDQGDWAYIPCCLFPPGNPPPKDSPVPLGQDAVLPLGAFPLQGLGIYHRITGYEPAGQLVRKLCSFLKEHARGFDAQGRFLPNDARWRERALQGNELSSHFHVHTRCLLNMLEYAVPSRDQVLLGFVSRSFEWARAQGELTVYGPKQRVPEWNLGYFPELLNSSWHEEAESCEIADMIGIGLKLSAAGVGDYWDDVDRWIRNQFAENQLMDTAWVHELSACFPKAAPPDPGRTRMSLSETGGPLLAGRCLTHG